MKKLSLLLLCSIMQCIAFAQSYTIATIAGTGIDGYSGDGGAATAAQLNIPTGIAIYSGNIYFIDAENKRIRKIDASGTITTVAGNGSLGSTGDGGPATAASIDIPGAIIVDNSGNLFFTSNYFIRKVSTSGIVTTIAGTGTEGLSSDGTSATNTAMTPNKLAIDNSGNIYFTEDSRIIKIDNSGIINVIAGSITAGYSGDGGPATAAQFRGLSSIALDNSNNIYVLDDNNTRIRKINNLGYVNLIGGNGVSINSGDGGPATSANIFAQAITRDGSGNIFLVAEKIIRMINTSGVISTVAGNGTYGSTGDCGSATAANVAQLADVTVDNSGNVYFSQWYGIGGNGYSTIRTLFITPGISGVSNICASANLTLTGNPLGGTWSSSNISIATVSAGGVVHGLAGGITTITYSVANSCNSYVTSTVTVNPLPNPGTIPTSPRIFCRSSPTTLTTSGDAGGIWSLSANTYATINSSTGVITGLDVASTAAHTVTVTYTTTNSCGSANTSRLIRIKGVPSASFSPTGSLNICTGDVRTITMSPSSPSYFTWSTTSAVSIATVSSNIAVVTGLASGTSSSLTYTYTNPDDSNVCATTIPIGVYNVVVKPTYSITGTSILSTGGVGCSPASATLTIVTAPSSGAHGSPNWSWAPTSPTTYASLSCTTCATSNTVTALASGGDEVITYSAYGSYCSVPSIANYTVTVNACKPGPDNIEEIQEKDFKVYPNPNSGNFTIVIPSAASSAAITISDMSGHIIDTRISAKKTEEFNLSNYSRGIYLISIETDDKRYKQKLLLQ